MYLTPCGKTTGERTKIQETRTKKNPKSKTHHSSKTQIPKSKTQPQNTKSKFQNPK
jgi:hypothetical protein